MNKNIHMYGNSIIYVLCPANLKTGGTELLHQLVNALNMNDRIAYITYYYEGKRSNKTAPTPKEFIQYTPYYKTINEIEDVDKNLAIFPEICIGKNRKFKHIQKIAWWLSVDNYLKMKGKLRRLKTYGIKSLAKHLILNDYIKDSDMKRFKLHMYQSYFAKSFLQTCGISDDCMIALSDYINDIYLSDSKLDNKEDIVIYNPKKGTQFTSQIINYYDSNKIKFIPIQNMTNIEVLKLMKKAKVYIDFGNHPGKDRIPREAAICGCCIITSLRGSARFQQDVPIPESSKFEDYEENIPKIIKRIRECMENYEILSREYDEYRAIIRSEKELFYEAAKVIFGR